MNFIPKGKAVGTITIADLEVGQWVCFTPWLIKFDADGTPLSADLSHRFDPRKVNQPPGRVDTVIIKRISKSKFEIDVTEMRNSVDLPERKPL